MRSMCSLSGDLALLALLVSVAAGCGRTQSEEDACADGQCACVFDTDCPPDFLCIDNVCVDREDYVECLANGIQPEVCNGRDDDCDGRTDEGLAERACERTADGLTCSGRQVCTGAAGYVCDAPVPAPETCDGVDNDCNGIADDPFVDADGQYTLVADCGGCGIDCRALAPDALEVRCGQGPQGPTCRVSLCPPGTYVNEAETGCLTLPDGLCGACATDDDCLGPGSRCLTFAEGERACGRDCGPSSPYGPACPSGYRCLDDQCRPVSETCLCTQETLGVTRSCLVDTCDGFETCESRGAGFSWGVCDISSWQETCDGLDNDCDGVIDDGFLNPATGRYESDLHCGQCNNDCTRQWAPEVDRAIGGCDASGGVPECRISQCTTETIGGTVFEWVDVNGAPDDGCECRRRQGNTTQDDPDRGPIDQLSGTFDENCDGIDGVIQDALFVRDGATPGGDGTIARPFDRIAPAIDALADRGRGYILVAEGVYRERVVLREGTQIFGGYSDDFLRRDVLRLATIVQSPRAPETGQLGSVAAEGIGSSGRSTIVSGLHIYAPDATGIRPAGQPGAASVAVLALDVGPGLVVQSNVIRGGRGGDGGRGPTGQTGLGRQQSTAVDGGAGENGRRIVGVCRAGTSVLGGTAGSNASCPVTNGRPGGGATCPTFDWNSTPVRGTQAQFTAPTTGGDGAGGWHRSFDELSRSRCGHVTESGFPSDFQTHNGADGRDGADGAGGSDGVGCGAAFGSFVGTRWISGAGGAGIFGQVGGAGAGGGAGGGTARFAQGNDFCDAHEVGSTGGGGGAGGCGGAGGAAGGSGGLSVAVLIANERAGAPPIVTDNRIERGPGGRGGDGGFGGPGGQGGRGGFGGRPTSWSGSTGGKGGDGGNGGAGGGGGGGCGGPSIGVLTLSANVDLSQIEFTVPSSAPTGGAGGQGGNGAPIGRGLDGGARNVLVIERCGAGGACPVGTACDANQICMPQ